MSDPLSTGDLVSQVSTPWSHPTLVAMMKGEDMEQESGELSKPSRKNMI